MKLFGVIVLSLLVISCNKPDPHPELKDPIYSDVTATLASTTQALEAEKKTLDEHLKALGDVVPQTGQIKYAQKRVDESRARIIFLEQEKQYLELKRTARQREARQSYTTAFKKGETWPNPAEWRAYEAEKRLRGAKRNWDVKERMKELNPEPVQPAHSGGH